MENEELKQVDENIAKLENELKNKKDIPQKEEKKIYKKVFTNIIIAIIIMVYFYLINLGSSNIETNVFIVDLKVFSMALITLTIILFEYSYKKESIYTCIYGLESFFLALITLFLVYGYMIYIDQFNMMIATAAFAFAVYYLIKAIIIYVKMRKKYIKNLNDINEIIKKK